MKTTLIIVKNKSVLKEVANNYVRSSHWTYTSNANEFTNGVELHQLMTVNDVDKKKVLYIDYDEAVTL